MEGKLQAAIPYLDMLFPFIPDYDDFQISEIIHRGKLSPDLYKEISPHNSAIQSLIVKLGYARNHPQGYTMSLTDLGIEAKSKGGHVKYQEFLKGKDNLQLEQLTLQVQQLRDEVFDYSETKSRSIKSLRIAYAGLALAVITLLRELLCNKHD